MITLQQLEDRQAVTDLISRLGLWLDGETTLERARAILAEDVSVSTPGGTAQGIEKVVAQARRNHEVPTQHVITNVLVDLDDERATAGANLIVNFPDATHGERYAFEARREHESWRLTRIVVEPLWKR
jgi:SnoaL-like domain